MHLGSEMLHDIQPCKVEYIIYHTWMLWDTYWFYSSKKKSVGSPVSKECFRLVSFSNAERKRVTGNLFSQRLTPTFSGWVFSVIPGVQARESFHPFVSL